MPFKLPFSSIESLPAREVLDAVVVAEKKRVADVRIYDLLYYEGEPISDGVYLFFAPDNVLLYAGKTKRFVERIPWHFALGEGSWMNHFLKYTRNHHSLVTLQEAADAASEDLLLLIPMERLPDVVKLERFFRLFGGSRYNSLSKTVRNRKRYLELDLGRSISEIIQEV